MLTTDSSTSSGKTTAICYSIDAETGNLRTKQIMSSDVVVIGINGEKRTSDEIFMTDKNLGSDNSDVIVSQTRYSELRLNLTPQSLKAILTNDVFQFFNF